MANTNDLKIVETELGELFLNAYFCTPLIMTQKEKKKVFDGIEPDIIAINKINSTLYVGEITTSGFFGPKKGKFHHGTVKKVFEAFSKFYLIDLLKENILERISITHVSTPLTDISCHFIMPKGAKSLQALGYRKKLFEQNIMVLDELELSDNGINIMHRVWQNTAGEMGRKE